MGIALGNVYGGHGRHFFSYDASKLSEEVMKIDLAAHYLEEIRRQLRAYKRLAEGAMAQVSDEEFFCELDPESNSMAVLVKHIAGNMRSRFTDFLTTDGEKSDRQRDREFEVAVETTRAEAMAWWEQGWKCVFDAITPLQPADLERVIAIRAEVKRAVERDHPRDARTRHAWIQIVEHAE